MRGKEKNSLLAHSGKVLVIAFSLLALAYLGNNDFHLRDLSATSGWMTTYGFSLIDLSAAGLILCSLQPQSLVFRVTAAWPLRMIGRYSYGFYVYHVLLAPFLVRYLWHVNPLWSRYSHALYRAAWEAGSFLIILAVSACSYHFLELPFLRLKDLFTVRHRNPGAQSSNATA
jgi:peptidoglycan/LPS O-acetylase OafA/YrhL